MVTLVVLLKYVLYVLVFWQYYLLCKMYYMTRTVETTVVIRSDGLLT